MRIDVTPWGRVHLLLTRVLLLHATRCGTILSIARVNLRAGVCHFEHGKSNVTLTAYYPPGFNMRNRYQEARRIPNLVHVSCIVCFLWSLFQNHLWVLQVLLSHAVASQHTFSHLGSKNRARKENWHQWSASKYSPICLAWKRIGVHIQLSSSNKRGYVNAIIIWARREYLRPSSFICAPHWLWYCTWFRYSWYVSFSSK